SAASTVGLRERIASSAMTEIGSVLDTVGIAVAPHENSSILFPAKRDVEADRAAKRRPGLSSRHVLLAHSAGCYGLRRFHPRRWQGMAAEIRIAAGGGGPLAAKGGARVPHLIFREVLGPAGVA